MSYFGNTDLTDLSSSLPSSLPSSTSTSQCIFTRDESEQELLPVTPKAGLTPRASFSNLLMFENAHKSCENDNSEELPLAPSSPLPSLFHSTSSLNLGNDPFRVNSCNLDFAPCSGQPMEWTPGSVWDSYAYQMHDDDSLPWNLIGFRGNNFIIIQSRDDCTGSLFSDKERD